MTTNTPASGADTGLLAETNEDQFREVLARLDAAQIWIITTALEMNQRGELTFDAALDRIKSELVCYESHRGAAQ